MSKQITKCPFCKSTIGYRYYARVEMQGKWGQEAESTGAEWLTRTVYCLLCGHRVSKARARGRQNEHV